MHKYVVCQIIFESIHIFAKDIYYNGGVMLTAKTNFPYWYRRYPLLPRKNIRMVSEELNTAYWEHAHFRIKDDYFF